MAYTTFIHGHLQIDHKLGIVYFHADPAEQDKGIVEMPFKLSGLQRLTFPLGSCQLDVTLRGGEVRMRRGVEIESRETIISPHSWENKK